MTPETIADFRQFCEAHEDFTDEQVREFLRDMAIAIVTEALRDDTMD